MDPQKPVLALSGLSVTLGRREVVAPLDTTFSGGALVALLGPNGAGKSSLVRAIAGLIPARGAITLSDRPLAALSRAEIARTIAYLPQGQSIHWPLPARDVVALGRMPHGAADPGRLAASDAKAVDEALARMDIAHLADRRVTELSGGEKARVGLARALATQAPILLADEPTAALDPRYQIAIMEALREEARRGALVIAVTHDLGLAARMADRVLMLDEGRLVADGPPGEALSARRLAEIYGVEVFEAERNGSRVLVPWESVA